MFTLHTFIGYITFIYTFTYANEKMKAEPAFCSWMFVGLLNTKEKRPR